MIEVALQAFGETFSPPLRRILLKSIGLAFLLLIVFGMILQGSITHLLTLPYPFDMALAIFTALGIIAGAIYLTQAALPSLIKSAPSDIVNVASIAGLEGFPEGSVYCAAKHGLVGFTRALAAEVKPEGVRVTALCSGSVDTEFFDRFRPTTEKEKRLHTDDVFEALLGILTSPAHVLHGEVVLRPRVV